MTTPVTVETVESSPSDDNDALYSALMNVDQGVADFGRTLEADAAPGETPAPAPDATDPAPTGDDPALEPPAAADPQLDGAPAPDTTDPFALLAKDAKPLAYTVNKESRLADGILEVPGKGGLITADKLPEFRNMLARYESNAEANKELYAFRQDVERMGGVAKFHEVAEQNAQLNAASVLILDALKNPRQFVLDDGTPNQERINFLIQQAGVAAERAKYTAIRERETQHQTWTQESSEASVRETAIPNAIDNLASRFNLSAEDTAAAKAHFGAFADALLFKATPEQALQWGVKPGALMVDLPKMEPWLRDRQALRASQAESNAAREKAAKENAARTTQPVLPPRKRDGTFTATPAKAPVKLSNHQLKRLALAGKPIPGDDDYVG